MVDATERLVNLALLLGDARGPVTATRIRDEVAGYRDEGASDEAAFKRMLERDKKHLRSMGLVIESDAEGNYRLDRGATFASRVTLEPDEAAALRAVGLALLADPSFPFARELRFALAKIASAISETAVRAVAHTADEDPERQSALVTDLTQATRTHKTAQFDYTNSYGENKQHRVEPYGLFARDGRWYVVGRDTEIDETRVYTVSRIATLRVEAARPETPDFERPADFDVSSFIGLPFQYGREEFEATLAFAPGEAWRAESLASGKGELDVRTDGGAFWRVKARSRSRLLQWVIENGPGISIFEPADLVTAHDDALARVAAMHGGGQSA